MGTSFEVIQQHRNPAVPPPPIPGCTVSICLMPKTDYISNSVTNWSGFFLSGTCEKGVMQLSILRSLVGRRMTDMCIQAHYVWRSSTPDNSFEMILLILTDSTAATSSRRGIETAFKGTTRLFPMSSEQWIWSCWFTSRMYEHCHIQPHLHQRCRVASLIIPNPSAFFETSECWASQEDLIQRSSFPISLPDVQVVQNPMVAWSYTSLEEAALPSTRMGILILMGHKSYWQ